ncbi:MAG: family 43 glycosylhydrolase, partial [Pontiellaceae bacterium]|nr:family 43 glycosylhydrolase [Pontiellaceae bacterium]
NNRDHRTGVLQSKTGDALGDYRDMGAVYTGDEIETGKNSRWAIDATPLEMNGKLYLIWSGWNGANDDVQSLFIAEMENPWTVKSNRVKITANDTYVWERVAESPGNKGLNEGPEILRNGDQIFLIYSCSGSWEPTYKLGQLSIREGQDPMNPDSWIKKSEPVCKGTDTVHGVGHCSFTKSPDGKEDWMVYHSKIGTQGGWQRNVRIEKFDWNADGSPRFPVPTTEGTVLTRPSGEKPPVAGKVFNDSFDNRLWDNWQYFGYNRYVDVVDRALVLGIDPGWGTANNYRSGEKAIVRDLVWDDFVFTSTIKVVKGDRDAGLIFRVTHPAVGFDAMKGYFAGIIPGRNRAILGKMNGKEWTEITSVDLPVESGRDYVLKVVARGDRIQFSVDGKPVIETTDSSYAAGFAGVRVVNVEASFDNIDIRAK